MRHGSILSGRPTLTVPGTQYELRPLQNALTDETSEHLPKCCSVDA